MGEVGIRELKQNASAVVDLTGVELPPLERLVQSGAVESPRGPKRFWDFGADRSATPDGAGNVLDSLMALREDER